MDVYTVSFFGHRRIEDSLKTDKLLYELLRDLLTKNQYVELLVGRNGDFDQLVSSAIRRMKRTVRNDNSSHVLVLPYLNAEFRDIPQVYEAYYDNIEICSESELAHYKTAYQLRNQHMARRSDLAVFWVTKKEGGAWKTLQYVKKHGIPYINLADPVQTE